MFEHTSTAPLPSRIASLVHAHFDALPTRSKPTVFPDGSREWIPMTGIVIVKGENTSSESLHCIAVTTGAKCLSASHIPRCQGLVLHDCHAEILAIRAFNYWILAECHGVLTKEKKYGSTSNEGADSEHKSNSSSPFVHRRREHQHNALKPSIQWPPLELQPDIKIYMYCTCAPCGDASMELCMASQEDAAPWEVIRQTNIGSEAKEESTLAEETLLDGRAHFSLLGVVRRKPARVDAESTRSKSCSDKLALRQVSSLLSCEASRLVAPTENAYLAGLILPEDEISRVGCERSFGESGRMEALKGRSWPCGMASEDRTVGYRFRPFQVLSVPAEEVEALWHFAKPKISADPGAIPRKSRPGNVSAVWTAAPSYSHSCTVISDTGSKTLPALRRSRTGMYETIINGVKQGNKAASPGARGASLLCRAKLWALLWNIVISESCHISPDASVDQEQGLGAIATDEPWGSTLQHHIQAASTYEDLKRAGNDAVDPLRVRAEAIQDAKKVLKGWVPNTGDESWGLDVLSCSKKRKH